MTTRIVFVWSGENCNLAETSLTEFHTILLQRLQCPDILPAWLGRAHCAKVPASSCLQARPRSSSSVLCALHHWPLTACLPALGLPCCGRSRHRGTHYLSRHTEFRSDVWGRGQVDREGGRLLRGWWSTAQIPLQLFPGLASSLRREQTKCAGRLYLYIIKPTGERLNQADKFYFSVLLWQAPGLFLISAT